MGRGIDRLVSDHGAGRVIVEKIVAFPIPRRPDGSENEAAPAIRTDVV